MGMLNRAMVYVDGFNLYFGLKESGWKRHYWLDVHALSAKIVRPKGLTLLRTKYFTSRIDGAHKSDTGIVAANKDAKRTRQTTYLESLATIPEIQIIEGKFLTSDEQCPRCRGIVSTPREKMTDVNIATELLIDAFHDKFDVAYIVSGDSDLSPPISAIRQHFAAKSVYVAFPPCRFSHHLTTVASGYFRINEPMLRGSQLPNEIEKPNERSCDVLLNGDRSVLVAQIS